jgi:hypothetical protein
MEHLNITYLIVFQVLINIYLDIVALLVVDVLIRKYIRYGYTGYVFCVVSGKQDMVKRSAFFADGDETAD